ncbi:MAG TPA: DedA family protein [Phycisphaerales bacterium]|nr:DedA family protein [Phycisphaerales bacterium]
MLHFLATTASDFHIDPEVMNAINSWGPWAVLALLILPLGEDLIIIPAGFLIGQGHLSFWPTFVCAYIGSFISDGIWYVAAYKFGTPLLHKRWFKKIAHPRRMLQAKHQIEMKGAWLIVSARFIPGSRTSTMIVSGLLHMPFWKFALAEGICLLVTVFLQLGAGYLIADQVIGNTSDLGKLFAIIGIVVVIVMGGFVVNWISAHRKSNKAAPRAKAAWLKRFRVPKPRIKKLQPSAGHVGAGNHGIAMEAKGSELTANSEKRKAGSVN